jgi:hypothetical protein
MRKEYDFSKGERGKFYGKIDTRNPIIEDDIDESDLEDRITENREAPQDSAD